MKKGLRFRKPFMNLARPAGFEPARLSPLAMLASSAQNTLAFRLKSYYAGFSFRKASRLIDWKRMAKQLKAGKHDLRIWVLQFALLCFIVFHGLGLFHNHATEAEHKVCVACQVAEHQSLDVPDAGVAGVPVLLVLLFLVLPHHPKALLGFGFYTRPQPRGPPPSVLS